MRLAPRAVWVWAALVAWAAVPSRGGEPPAASEARSAEAVLWVGPRPARPPRRVVTLAPSLTDVVLGLGLGDRIVGVTRMDRAPEVASRPRVGGYLDPNPEAILALQPDLVLWTAEAAEAGQVRRLAALSRASSRPFPILVLPAETVADALAAPRIVGEAMGASGAGRALQASMTAAVERFRDRARRGHRRRVLFVVGREPLVVAGPGSFPDELLRLAGCENVVASGPRWPVYPLEKAIADDPDLVIDAALDEPESSVARLSVIPALRRGARFALTSDDLLRPGPRMILGLEELLRALRRGPT